MQFVNLTEQHYYLIKEVNTPQMHLKQTIFKNFMSRLIILALRQFGQFQLSMIEKAAILSQPGV